ncbi:hypothetical protein [Cryptosporangium japonicum]|uniref:hypothetical protein n=1 Tax=Cryptosporangium japonicum TaxID=80872 RepID=UPI0031DC7F79
MVDEVETLRVRLDRDDLKVLREHGVDAAELAQTYLRERAERFRADDREQSERRRRLIREVAAERRASGADYSADEIVADIHADRRAAGWE